VGAGAYHARSGWRALTAPQLGLYFSALGNDRRACDALQKALFIAPDDVPALVHLCRLQLARGGDAPGAADLAAGMLEACTRGAGWDVPEAWHALAQAYTRQGRAPRARECLLYALELAQGRGVREIGAAVGWML
jgi:tetratricopeptide (TPR) repeat protein